MTVEELIELCHQGAHTAPHDYEDTLMVQLTQAEVWLVHLALLLLSQSAPCLAGFCAETMERLAELLDVQKPEWRTAKDV